MPGVRHLPLVALLFFVASLALGPMAESDLFFRIEAGEEILAHHGLPGRNLYSFTYPDYPDVDTSWLFEVGAAGLHRAGGFPAVVLAKTLVVVGVFAAAYALARRRGAGPLASVLALAAAAYVGRERFVERPHLFSLAGVVLVLFALDGLVAAEARPLRRAPALLVLLAIALWANLHAGVFLAAALPALASVGAALERRWTPARRMALLALGAGAATLATPVGIGLYRYLRLHTLLPGLHPVDEFRAATWVSDASLFLFGAAVVAAAAHRPRRFAILLPVAALGVLALRSVRFSADFALVAAPVVAVGLSSLAETAKLAVRPAVAALAVAALLGGLGAARGRRLVTLGLDESALPLDAIRFVEQQGLRERMYNDFEIGSYLLYQGYPRYRVFVDPRLPAYPPELHRLLGRFDLSRAEWDAAMRGYGVESALLDYAGLNRRVAWWDPEAWALVYRAHDARVFVRRLPRFAALIAAREIPATFSFTVEEGAATVPLEGPPAASPVPGCEWQRRLGDLLFELDGAASPRARAAYQRALAGPAGCLAVDEEAHLAGWMGALELHDSHAAAALPLLERAIARGEKDVATLANRALALEAAGRRIEAGAAWGEVAAHAGVNARLAETARAKQAALGAR